MRYFTKEWYELSQRTSFHLLLEEESQAETFSEAYFQQLYSAELNKWLHLHEEVASIMQANGTNEPFNKDKETKQFYESIIYNQEHLKKSLPETILNQIADLRVFALNKATRDVINTVSQFCEDNKRSVDTTIDNYRKYHTEASLSMDREIVDNFRFHDCRIIKSILNDKSITLLLDNTGGFTDIDELIFENVTIIKQDAGLENSWWLYEEVYKVNDKYEFHMLLQNQDTGLINFIISAEQAFFRRLGSDVD
ncbi:DUF4085 domain-containing protein [Paenibacillus sp. KQZ6P-2]|uniref:DUF4085 domain-containing protein n=1 Tax=Paenibacillus mangrovi TaxID=2931978 RepID=A0A9X2B0R2_9BACL|nr:DUF4085 family protein [Paenibacillus mangrovi]MCJ8010754.1 DUF4085 domain-containing protein [Paenibacillus mangrovi]